MTVFRLSGGRYRHDLSGKGAELHGGRWNSKGTALVYTSQSRALAYAEVSIHLPLGIVPKDYHLITIHLPDTASILELPEEDLPPDWRSNPHGDSTQRIGDRFAAEATHLALRVPSAVVPGDFNFLLNPAHPMMTEVRITHTVPFEFDSRFASGRA
ncbi:MAG TPA: RES family NAD+ phosphorylase [Chitinophagaceae bacterium]|jgi:RES domain-containing protein|nr:RES family NAD+ phosphorylase [Chitinophagaceae bacterium]